MKKDSKSESSANLRQKAEAVYKQNSSKSGFLHDDAQTLKLIHDLEVHKIELEMQNEELRLAKEQITADAEKYADLYDFAPSGYFTLAKNGEIIELNFCGSRMLGNDRTFLISKMFGLYVSDDSKPIFNRFLDKVFSSKSQHTCEVALQVNSNPPMYVHLSGTVTENSEQCLIIAHDITDLKLSEVALRESNEMFSAFMRHSPIYTFIKEVNQDESRVLKASENFRDMIGICGSEMAGKTMYELFPAEYAAKFTADDWKVVSGGEGITLDEDLNGRNYISIKFPIDLGGKTLLAGYTIDITERKQAEAALSESEKQYTSLFNNFLDSVAVHQIVLDETGKPVDYIFLQANAAFETQTGLHVADILGKRATEVIPGIEKTPFIDTYGKVALTGEPITFDQFSEPLNRHFHINAFQSGAGQFCTVFQDITMRRKAEEALRDSEAKFKNLVWNMQVGVILQGPDSGIRLCNPKALELLGLTEDQLLGKTSFDADWNVIHEDGTPFPGSTHPIPQSIISRQAVRDVVMGVYRPDKHDRVWLLVDAEPQLNSDGEVQQVVCTFVDISGRKQTEEALIQNRDLLANLARLVPGVIYQYRLYPDGRSAFPYSSPGMNDIYEVTPEEVREDATPVFSRLHPDDFDHVADAIQESVRTLNTFYCEYRVRMPRQGIRWRLSQAQPIRLEDGSILWHGIISDITERKLADEALIESERKFRDTVTNLDEGYYSVTMDGVLLEHNQAFCRILGIDATADLNGIHLPDFWQHPEKRSKYLDAISAKGSVSNFQIEVKTQAGEKRTVLASAHLVKDKDEQPIRIEGIFLDITDRILLEASLQRHAERLQNLRKIDKAILSPLGTPEAIIQNSLQHIRSLLSSQHASIGIFDFESDALQLFVAGIKDRSVEKVEEYMIDKAYGDLEILRQNRMDIVEDISLKSSQPELLTILQSEGIMSCINVPLVSGEKLIGAMNLGWGDPRSFTPEELEIASEVADEITIAIEQVRLRQATKHYAEELEKRVEERTSQLLAANKELEAFSYSVSHDLRAPLRHINGYISILSKHLHDLPEKEKHYLDTIADSAHQMGVLIDDLLNFSRTGRQEMQLTTLDMNVVIQDAMQLIKHESIGHGIKWEVAELPQVVGDYSLLRLVWLNLLSNAVKFSRVDVPTLIEVGFVDDNNEFVFFVRDNGVGFDMQYAHKLFGVFERLHSAQEFEGTGIGLANVRRIILRHNGRTWAEAEIDKGATFYFSLPKG